MSTGFAFVGDAYYPLEDARISVFDPGFNHSDVVYDVTSTWRGLFFRLDDHIARFLKSCAGIHLRCPYGPDDLKRILATCVDRGGVAEGSFVSVALTRGEFSSEEAWRSRDIFRTNATLIAYALPYMRIADEEMQQRGMRAIIAKTPRIPDACVNTRYKNYHWGDLTAGKFEAREAGADTCVLLSIEGFLTEGPGFNLFFVQNGTLCTPGRNILLGITRQSVIDIAKDLAIPLRVGDYRAEALLTAEEAFVTSTAGGVMPLVSVGDTKFSGGCPGPLSRRLRAEYWGRRERGWFGTSVAALLR